MIKKLIGSVQFKRKVSFVLAGLGVAGALYLMYYKGRTDEIREICNIVKEHGDVPFTFRLKKGAMKIGMTDLTH